MWARRSSGLSRTSLASTRSSASPGVCRRRAAQDRLGRRRCRDGRAPAALQGCGRDRASGVAHPTVAPAGRAPCHECRRLGTGVRGSGARGSAVAGLCVFGRGVFAGPKDRLVDESWPVDGVRTSFYARHKVEVERRLDLFEREHTRTRVVRLRPALIFQRGSAYEQRRLFAGPFLPSPLLRRRLLPVVPAVRGLRFQVVHAIDVADAYRRAVIGEARGAFNIAAEPVLDADAFANALAARPLSISPRLVRAAMAAAFHLRLQPSPPGWLDLGLRTPLLDSTRARVELGWAPRHDGAATLRELIDGIRDNAGAPTPPLDPSESGPLRAREIATLAGEREQK